jgi:hypothetical protein
MKRWVILLTVWLVADRAWADGGTLRLRRLTVPYRVAVFTSPALLRAGPIDISVLVQDAATGKHLPQTKVTVYLREQDGSTTLQQPATIGAATNKLFHAAEFEVPRAGRWQVEVELAGQQGSARVAFDIEAAQALPRWLEFWPWIAWPAGVVVLFGLHQLLVRRASARSSATPS